MFSIGDVVSNTSHCWRIYFFRPQTFWLDIRSVMTYILVVVWLDISIASAPYLRQRVLIIHFTVLFVIAFSAFHSIRSRIFHPLHAGAVFSSPAFSTIVIMVLRFPVSRFPPLHFWRCRVFRSRSRIFSRPGLITILRRFMHYVFRLRSRSKQTSSVVLFGCLRGDARI